MGGVHDQLVCRDEGEQIKSRVADSSSMASAVGPGHGPRRRLWDGHRGRRDANHRRRKRTGGQGPGSSFGPVPFRSPWSNPRSARISPTLGSDSLAAGLKAGAIGLALVMIYTLLYYRALGLVVWGGLLIFAAALFSLVTVLSRGAGLSLSLAGVAGFRSVSLGVTADSYIVSFERLKDEIRSGKTMRAASAACRGHSDDPGGRLRDRFGRGHFGFFLAVRPVRGFAVTLGAGDLLIDVWSRTLHAVRRRSPGAHQVLHVRKIHRDA